MRPSKLSKSFLNSSPTNSFSQSCSFTASLCSSTHSSFSSQFYPSTSTMTTRAFHSAHPCANRLDSHNRRLLDCNHCTHQSSQSTQSSLNRCNFLFKHSVRFTISPKRRRKKEREYMEWLEKHRNRIRTNNPQIYASPTDSASVHDIDQTHAVPLSEAIIRVCRLSRLTYDETVSFEVQLNLNPKRGNEYIRGNIVLPNGTGKERKICVFIPEGMYEEAMAEGADMIGDDELLEEIGNGMHPPFDVCIATPEFLRKLVPYGRQLGPLGLMPNPKMGTLTSDPIGAIKNAKLGQLPIRMSDGGNGKGVICGSVGKVSFGEDKIRENVNSFVTQLREELKPPGAVGKKQYFLKAYLSSQQGRGYQVMVDTKEPWKKKVG